MEKLALSYFASGSVQSSLSRIRQHSLEHDTGTISAFRKKTGICADGKEITKGTNLARNKSLQLQLLNHGYGVTVIQGKGQESGGSADEVSFFVVDLKDKGTLKKDLIKLGEAWEQDSVTFSEKGDKVYTLISTNKCPYGTGEGKVGVEIKLGRPSFGNTDVFYSVVNGRPFTFSLASNERVVNNPLQKKSIGLWASQSVNFIHRTLFSDIK